MCIYIYIHYMNTLYYMKISYISYHTFTVYFIILCCMIIYANIKLYEYIFIIHSIKSHILSYYRLYMLLYSILVHYIILSCNILNQNIILYCSIFCYFILNYNMLYYIIFSLARHSVADNCNSYKCFSAWHDLILPFVSLPVECY